jgi:hypothetical protein
MQDPVMDLCAHNFERDAIVKWLANHACCPISRKPLSVEDLVPNHTLAERIERWQFLQETDGIMWDKEQDRTAQLSESSDEESVDGESQLYRAGGRPMHANIESGRKKKKKKAIRGTIPAHFMLLPQEREVLEIVRIRAATNRQKRRRRAVRHAFFAVVIATALVFLGLGAQRLYLTWRTGENGN